MSVQTKALIKRWQEFKDVAIAEACINYHEEMIEGWKETLDQEIRWLEDDTRLRQLEEDSRGQWFGADYHNYVTREEFRKAMIRDLDVMCRRWKFADDMEGEEE